MEHVLIAGGVLLDEVLVLERIAETFRFLFRVDREAPLVHLEVDDFVEPAVAGGEDDGVDPELNAVADGPRKHLNEGRTAVGTVQGRDGMDEIAMAALEERGKVVRIGAVDLILRALLHEGREQAEGRAAEGVTDEVDLRVVAGSAEVLEDAGIGAAVAGMAILLEAYRGR